MKVSIVLTTYNRANVLSESLDSILAQTFSDFELLICDNCSTDNTAEVCRTYAKRDPRISYHRHDSNLGMPGNLNAGIKLAKGQYIANLHDGDTYAPTLIEKWAAALDLYPTAGFVFNAYRILAPDGSELYVSREPLPPCTSGHVLLEQIFFKRWMFSSPVWGMTMMRKSVLDTLGLFDEQFGFIADVDMWMRIAEHHDVAYINEPLMSLIHKDVAPRMFSMGAMDERRDLEQMFLKARMAHYKMRPLRKVFEAGVHWGMASTSRAWIKALAARRFIKGLVKKGA